MFEHRSQPLATRRVFLFRVMNSLLVGLAVVALSMLVGAWGYHVFAGLDWVDACLDAAMILTGMGPVHPLKTTPAKLFAVFYCLFSGIIFLSMMAIILTPIYHRMLHQFHLEEDNDSDRPD